MFNGAMAAWTTGVDTTASLMPGSTALSTYEAQINATGEATQDPFGHGTHVAAVAAGRAKYYAAGTPDTTGIAPNAKIYDVRVLDADGYGTVSDAIEGIQWAIYHAKEYKIRVLNISLAADSTETWQTDPLCAAARSAVAAGITVVAAAGNFGKSIYGEQVYGAVGAPGNDPSVITVGAVNYHDTVARADDTVTNFSSRGPTRSSYINSSGVRVVDNLLKPDLVAPGNKIVSAAATAASSSYVTWNFLADTFYSVLVAPLGITQLYPETQMIMSGTSIAAPAVSGAVALMLQANPGLTPPLIKAILQYTAQPLPNYNLLQQGAGMLNVDGAMALSKVLRTDIATKIE
jgi:subtilisin family serine protease